MKKHPLESVADALSRELERANAERNQLAERCRELEAEKRLLVANELEFGKVAEKSVATIDALRAEVERLRKDAERYRSQFGAGGWDYHESWIGQKKDFVDAEIDAALEVSR